MVAQASACVLLFVPFAVYFAAPTSDVADAVERADSVTLQKLISQKADVNVPQADGATALHWAVYRSDQKTVDLLLGAGANPKAANREGSTPLWLASVNGNAGIISSLLKAGADPNEKLPLGRTPLMEAARTGNVDAIRVLIDHGADVNAKETLRGTTPIMWAADQGHAKAIEYLIEKGADFKATSSPAERGRGPALGKAGDPRKQVAANGEAVKNGRPAPPLGGGRAGRGGGRGRGGAAAGATGAAGADQFDENAFGFVRNRQSPMDGGGITPLVYAVLADSLDSVKTLLAAGADINQTTN